MEMAHACAADRLGPVSRTNIGDVLDDFRVCVSSLTIDVMDW